MCYFVYWPAVVNPTLSAGVVVVPLSASWRVWCTRRTGSNTVLKLRRNMWEVLQGGKERKGYRRIHSQRNILLHKHVYMHCPRNAAVQCARRAPGTAAGPSPGPETTVVGPCRARDAASRCQYSNICFTSLFPPLVFQDLPPRGGGERLQTTHGHESLCISMLAIKIVFPLQVQLPLQ